MLDRLKTFLSVAIITGLIWVFAEAETLRTQEQPVELTLDSGEGGMRTLEFADASAGPRRWNVSVVGPTAAVEDLVRRLRAPVRLAPGMDGVPLERGTIEVDLKTVLLGHPDLTIGRRGVSIARVDPPTARLRLDDLVTIDLPVEVRIPTRGELDGPPEIRPARVKVIVPSAEVERVGAGPVLAVIDQSMFDRLVPGRKETLGGVALRLAPEMAGIRARIDPATAEVSLAVRRSTTTLKIPSVPVHVRLAPTEINKWEIEIADPFLADVSVTGPRDVIRRIEDKTIPLIAYLALSYEELERGVTSKDAVFGDLPPELGPLTFEATSRSVRLTIKRREAPQRPAP